MDTVVNGQSDEHRHECNGQNVEVTDNQGGESHGVSQPDNQARDGFEWTPGSPITNDKNQGAQRKRDNGSLRRVTLRLFHLIVFQNRFSSNSDINSRNFRRDFGH